MKEPGLIRQSQIASLLLAKISQTSDKSFTVRFSGDGMCAARPLLLGIAKLETPSGVGYLQFSRSSDRVGASQKEGWKLR